MAEIERREAFKEAVNNCPHCGDKMEFNYDYDFLHNLLKEDCLCPHCAVQVRSELHPLQ